TLRTTPVYSGTAADAGKVEVIDIIVAPSGAWRLFYIAIDARPVGNARTALSNDEGLTFGFESDNPFGDLMVANPGASNVNVDSCLFRFSDGTYLAVTMRGAQL